MISPDIFKFLEKLKKNNNREWFQENRPEYLSCKEGFEHVVELLIHAISEFDSSVKGLEPKKCIFRINRDIRFSKDKSPYKTNFGAFMAPGGRNNGTAGYYLHLEPGASFLAGGIYMPPSPILKAIRQEIFDNYEEFLSIVTEGQFVKHFKAIDADKLKTRPKGFPEDFVGLEYLKFKHYTVLKSVTEAQLTGANFFEEAKETFRALQPLNRFLNQAVSEA